VQASEAYVVSSQQNPSKSWARRVFSGLQHAMGRPVATGGDLVHIADAVTGRVAMTLVTPFGDEGDLLAQTRADLLSMTAHDFAAAYEIDR